MAGKLVFGSRAQFALPPRVYYSVRGPRFDERPPDVGRIPPGGRSTGLRRLLPSPLLGERRLASRLQPGHSGRRRLAPREGGQGVLPASAGLQLSGTPPPLEHAKVDAEGVRLAGMHYRAVVLDGLDHWPKEATPALEQLAAAGRLILWGDSASAQSLAGARQAKTPPELLGAIDRLIPPDVTLRPASESIRYRHVIKGNRHFYIFFNEEAAAVDTTIRLASTGKRQWLDPSTGRVSDAAPIGRSRSPA